MNYESDPEVEYSNLLNGVQIWDVGCERQVQITGPDTMKLAQLLTPRNLSGCAVGHQVENADMQFRRTRKSGSVFRRNDIATLLGMLFERRQVRMRHERHGFSFPAEPVGAYSTDTCHAFHVKPATQTAAKLPPDPRDVCRPAERSDALFTL